ncbi:hypothetical protein [Alloalcanivorax xenomutans]
MAKVELVPFDPAEELDTPKVLPSILLLPLRLVIVPILSTPSVLQQKPKV